MNNEKSMDRLKGESAKKVLGRIAERNRASIAEVNALRGSANEFKRGFYEGQWGAYYNVAWWIEDESSHEAELQERAERHPDQLLMIMGCDDPRTGKHACLALDGAFLRLYALMDPKPSFFAAPIENAFCVLYPAGDIAKALADYRELEMRIDGVEVKEGVVYAFPKMEAHKIDHGHLFFECHGKGKELASMGQAEVTMPDWRAMPWTR